MEYDKTYFENGRLSDTCLSLSVNDQTETISTFWKVFLSSIVLWSNDCVWIILSSQVDTRVRMRRSSFVSMSRRHNSKFTCYFEFHWFLLFLSKFHHMILCIRIWFDCSTYAKKLDIWMCALALTAVLLWGCLSAMCLEVLPRITLPKSLTNLTEDSRFIF